jgi:RNA polymerase sporulation-specific sigma factor
LRDRLNKPIREVTYMGTALINRRRIEKYRTSNEEINRMAVEAGAGSKEAQDDLLKYVQSHIKKHTLKLARKGYEWDDLYQVASMSVLKSAETYKADTGVNFTSYIGKGIQGRLQRYIRDQHPLIKLPRSLYDTVTAIYRLDLVEKKPEEAYKEIQKMNYRTEYKLENVVKALDYVKGGSAIYSLEFSPGEGTEEETDRTVGDALAADVNTDWFESLTVKLGIEKLDEKLQKLVHYRFYIGLTQKEAGQALGLSQMQISRLEQKALEELQRYFTGEEAPKPLPRKKKNTGDREKAIQLLKETELRVRDISEITGVPEGSMTKLMKLHRPRHVTEAIRRRQYKKKKER